MSFENFDAPRDVSANAKMECGVCWHVYDPAARRRRLADSAWRILQRIACGLALSELRRAAGEIHEARR